jgi:hypothetical protein
MKKSLPIASTLAVGTLLVCTSTVFAQSGTTGTGTTGTGTLGRAQPAQALVHWHCRLPELQAPERQELEPWAQVTPWERVQQAPAPREWAPGQLEQEEPALAELVRAQQAAPVLPVEQRGQPQTRQPPIPLRLTPPATLAEVWARTQLAGTPEIPPVQPP